MTMFKDIFDRWFALGTDVEASEPDEVAQSQGVVMYTTMFCPYCVQARMLLDSKGIDFEDIGVDGNPELHGEMMEKSGRSTVPQIWIGDQHIGGCEQLYQLERKGELDPLLSEFKR